MSIISDRGTQFTSYFWKDFPSGNGKKVKLNTTFNHKTDGQEENTIQTFEDMLRVCVIDCKGNWDEHLPLIEFSYNNSSHSTISMKPINEINRRRCRSQIGWYEVSDIALLSPDFVYKALKKVWVIRNRLKV